jgi:hypothetical protein
MQAPTIDPVSKLEKVSSLTLSGGKYRYIGHFADGSSRKIRESFRKYGEVVQIAPVTYPDGTSPEEFIFGSKKATVASYLRERVVAIVSVEQ